MIGVLVWAIFTIQHVNAMKKCKCPESIAQKITYGFAIIELIAWAILTLQIMFIVYIYSTMVDKERKSFRNAFTREFTKEFTKTT